MLSLRNIHKHHRSSEHDRIHILKGIDLQIRCGEFVAIMGSSGSGKSTLLNILGLLDNHFDGDYHLDGQRIGSLCERDAALLRNRKLGFVFQSFNLLPFKNAIENVALPLYYQGVNRRERNRRAEQWLEQLGLTERKHHFPGELSGGQKQRVAIARALINQPKVILADEPTGALDDTTTVDIMLLLKQLHSAGHTLVMVTHDQAVADQAERQIVLRDGHIMTSSHCDAMVARRA